MKKVNQKQQTIKRMIDVVFGWLLLLFSLIFIVPAAILIKLEDGGPILFRQIRVGKDGKLFVMYKLRSMKVHETSVEADSRSELYRRWEGKVPDEFVFKQTGNISRNVTKIGRLIRKTSIDELPQFWNVVIGNMSLIGPRPEVPDIADHYDQQQQHRLKVRPGITGWAQINGRSDIMHGKKIILDNYYVDSFNLLLDAKILFLTFIRVIKKEGAI